MRRGKYVVDESFGGQRRYVKPTAEEKAIYNTLQERLDGPDRDEVLREIIELASQVIERDGRKRGVASIVDWSADA